MRNGLKQRLRSALVHVPHDATAFVRKTIAEVATRTEPYCPPSEGDFIHAIIRQHAFRRCVETGFYTGSTALYMADAAGADGHVTSICLDDDATVTKGQALLDVGGVGDRHTLVRGHSIDALGELVRRDTAFDFAYVDGWKTFDHLTVEAYALNRMLVTGGVVFFDDAQMPSVRRVANLMRRYYGYADLAPATYGINRRTQVVDRITRHTWHLPYLALRKTTETRNQAPFADYTFDRRL